MFLNAFNCFFVDFLIGEKHNSSPLNQQMNSYFFSVTADKIFSYFVNIMEVKIITSNIGFK